MSYDESRDLAWNQSDSTDKLGFSWSKKAEKSEELDDPNMAPAPYEDCYKMNHKRRGIAIIFNHEHFSMKECSTRHGSNKDRDDLEVMLHELEFNVLIHNDLTAGEVAGVLLTASRFDYSDCDCLLIVVMSHGNNGIIYARDREYPAKRLWDFFTASGCPTLAGKPKLFFIQACRGNSYHEAQQVQYRTEEDSSKNSDAHYYTIPVMADILIMYSTMEGFYSWRDSTNGSYFIQSLIRQITKHSKTRDLLTILTFVNREVAIDFTSLIPETPEFSNTKQMCSIVSMLTRILYFTSSRN